MSFWNNPENNGVKTILIVIVVIVAGFFVYKYVHTNSLQSTGQVINTSSVAGGSSSGQTVTFSIATNGSNCTENVCSSSGQCVAMTGTSGAEGTCNLNSTQPNATAQGLLSVLNGTNTTTPAQSGQTVGFSITTNGSTCTENVCNASGQCIAMTGTSAAGGACSLNATQPNPTAQGMYNIVKAGNTQ